jgi:hypothetical protein
MVACAALLNIMSRTRSRDNSSLDSSVQTMTVEVTNMDTGFQGSTIVGSLNPGQTKSLVRTVSSTARSGEVGNIIDNPGSYTGPIKPYRTVTHTKTDYQCSNQPFSVEWTAPNPVAPFKVCKTKITGSGSPTYWIPFSVPLPSSTTDSQLRARAIGSARPDTRGSDADLPLFIGELSDFSDLWKEGARSIVESFQGKSSLVELLRKSRRYYVPFGRNIPKGTLERADRFLTKAIGTDLAWKFAIEPTMNVIIDIRNAWDELENSYHARLRNRLVVVRGRSSVTESSIVPSLNLGDWVGFDSDAETTRECCVWTLLEYDYTNYSLFDHLRNTYGLSFRLSTMYQLIPLSFILDWFVNIGRAMRSLEADPVPIPYRIVQQGQSFKTVTQGSVTITPGSNCNYSSRIGIPAGQQVRLTGTYRQSSYSRSLTSFNYDEGVAQPPEVGLPNFGQSVTLAELAYLFGFSGKTAQ